MGFVASEKIDKLDYDFTMLGVDDDGDPCDIPGLEGCKGVTPEPSATQIRRMKYLVREIFREQESDAHDSIKIAKQYEKALEHAGDDDAADIPSRIKAMSEEDFARSDKAWVEAIAEVTSGRPSAEQIALLPGRVQQHFCAYMWEKLSNPQSASEDTKPSLAPVKSA